MFEFLFTEHLNEFARYMHVLIALFSISFLEFHLSLSNIRFWVILGIQALYVLLWPTSLFVIQNIMGLLALAVMIGILGVQGYYLYFVGCPVCKDMRSGKKEHDHIL